MTDEEYVVALKPSARRSNATVGRLVFERGPCRAFDSRALADEWARRLSRGDGDVFVRDANPNDGDDVDGYLISNNALRVGERDLEGPLAEFV